MGGRFGDSWSSMEEFFRSKWRSVISNQHDFGGRWNSNRNGFGGFWRFWEVRGAIWRMCLGVCGWSTEYDFGCPWSIFLEFVGLSKSIHISFLNNCPWSFTVSQWKIFRETCGSESSWTFWEVHEQYIRNESTIYVMQCLFVFSSHL